MDGQCQDEFLRCMDPDLEQEGINVTFRWIKRNAASCSFLRDRGGVLFANVCAGFIRFCCGVCGERRFLGFLGAPWFLFLFMWEVPALSVYSFMCTVPGPRRCAYRWTPPRAKVGASSSWPTGQWSPLKALAGKVDRVVPTTGAQQSTFKSSGLAWTRKVQRYGGWTTVACMLVRCQNRNGNVPLLQILTRTGAHMHH